MRKAGLFNWIDIGRVSDYWSVLQRVLRGDVAQLTMPGREVKPGIWVGINTRIPWDQVDIQGPVYIGSSVCIEAGRQHRRPGLDRSRFDIAQGRQCAPQHPVRVHPNRRRHVF